jgi:poly(A) polymerase
VAPHDALALAADTLISQQVARLAIPRRFTQVTREIWALQLRLLRRTPKRVRALAEHPRFRAAYDFLALRADAGEPVDDAVAWWTRYQQLEGSAREALADQLAGGDAPGRRRRRRRGGRT